jgi:predicted anti-sigma-YlaC factor YlaD
VTTANRDEVACQELVEIVTDYLEDALPDEKRELFEAHLQECEGCRRYLDQMRTTIHLAGRVREKALDPNAKDQLLQLFRDWNQS